MNNKEISKTTKSTEELVVEYYRNDRRRTMVALLTIFIAAIFIILVFIRLYQLQNRLDARTKDIQTQISCVGDYFSQTDRANLRIPNLGSCNIIRDR